MEFLTKDKDICPYCKGELQREGEMAYCQNKDVCGKKFVLFTFYKGETAYEPRE